MKLLVVASTFPADDSDPVPAFVRDQVVHLRRTREDVQICVLAPHDARARTSSKRAWRDYEEYRFHYFWPFNAQRLAGRGILPALAGNPLLYFLVPFLFVGEFIALLRLARKIRPDLIYAHWITPQAIVCCEVSRITGIPFVFTTHAADATVWNRIPLVGRWVVRRCVRRACAFTAVSGQSMTRLRSFFDPAQWKTVSEKGAVIPMGITMPDGSTTRRMGQGDRKVILFLGRLVPKKGVKYLLQAFASIKSSASCSLIIAGDGPERDHLEALAANLGLSGDVSFRGFVTGEEKQTLLRDADVFAVPSIVAEDGDAEGLPVSLMEGLAHGKVCIATPESGAIDVLTDGLDGFLVPQKDVQELANALMKACTLTPGDRQAMEAAARQTSRQFEWQTIAARYDAFLLAPFA